MPLGSWVVKFTMANMPGLDKERQAMESVARLQEKGEAGTSWVALASQAEAWLLHTNDPLPHTGGSVPVTILLPHQLLVVHLGWD